MALDQLANQADLVLVGKVLARSIPPSAYSGAVEMLQVVVYRVVELLKGDWPYATIDLFHHVVEGDSILALQRPALSPALFRTGRDLLCFARRAEGPERKGQYYWETLEDGVLPASPARLREVRDLLWHRWS